MDAIFTQSLHWAPHHLLDYTLGGLCLHHPKEALQSIPGLPLVGSDGPGSGGAYRGGRGIFVDGSDEVGGPPARTPTLTHLCLLPPGQSARIEAQGGDLGHGLGSSEHAAQKAQGAYGQVCPEQKLHPQLKGGFRRPAPTAAPLSIHGGAPGSPGHPSSAAGHCESESAAHLGRQGRASGDPGGGAVWLPGCPLKVPGPALGEGWHGGAYPHLALTP